MYKYLCLSLCLLFFAVLPAKELFIDPDGGSVYSGRMITADGNIQSGPASSVEIEIIDRALKITLVSCRQEGWKPEFLGKKHDDTAMFAGETAEVFLMPGKSADYFHFALDPAGNMYTARNRDFRWEPQVPVKGSVKIAPRQWQAQFVIPFASVNAPVPVPGTVWLANFALSTFRNSGRKPASWSGAVSFHEPGEMGKLIFDKKENIRLKSWNVENNILHAELFIPEKLRKNTRSTCTVDGKEFEFASPEISIPLADGKLNPKSISDVIFQVKKAGAVIFQQRITVPWYLPGNFTLDRFYVTPADRFVEYCCDLPSPLQIRILRSGSVLKEYSGALPAGKISMENISPGRIVVEAVSQKNHISARRLLIVCDRRSASEPLPAGMPEMAGTFFRIGGKPVFLIGGTATPAPAHHAPEIFNWDISGYGVVKNAVRLRRLPYIRLIRKPSVGYVYHNNWQDMIDKSVTSSHPGQMHRISYEAQLDIYFERNGKLERYDSAPFLKKVYSYAKSRYPERIFTLQCDRNTVIADYKDSCDVLEGAFWTSSYAENLLTNIRHDMQMLRQLAGEKPAVFWIGISVPSHDVRVAEEVRAGVYAAVLSDMAGIVFHMGHGGIPRERMRLWSVISGINAEISRWYPGYASGKKLDDFIISTDPQFITRAWQAPDGRYYIGAVNLSAGERELILKHKRGVLRETFTAFDARIYPLD